MIEMVCVSVAGGWQSGFKATGEVFGPVFNDIRKLWAWQRENPVRSVL